MCTGLAGGAMDTAKKNNTLVGVAADKLVSENSLLGKTLKNSDDIEDTAKDQVQKRYKAAKNGLDKVAGSSLLTKAVNQTDKTLLGGV